MKKMIGFLFSLLFSLTVFASTQSKLMLVENGERIDTQELASKDELASMIDRNSQFCFIGNVEKVLNLIKKLNQDGHFFSGGGGGYTIEKLTVTKKGIVGPKINLVIRSEVTNEVHNTIYILRCF